MRLLKTIPLFLAVSLASCLACAAPRMSAQVPSLLPRLKLEMLELPPRLEVYGPITKPMADSFIKALEKADESGVAVIVIPINSEGGDVDAGAEMVAALERTVTPTRCIVEGMAASMAFYLLQHCDDRVIVAGGTLMAHQVSVGGVFPNLTIKQLESMLSELRASTKALVIPAARRMCMNVETFLEKIDGQDWWMASDDAFAYNAVDRILSP